MRRCARRGCEESATAADFCSRCTCAEVLFVLSFGRASLGWDSLPTSLYQVGGVDVSLAWRLSEGAEITARIWVDAHGDVVAVMP